MSTYVMSDIHGQYFSYKKMLVTVSTGGRTVYRLFRI